MHPSEPNHKKHTWIFPYQFDLLLQVASEVVENVELLLLYIHVVSSDTHDNRHPKKEQVILLYDQ